MTQHFALTAVLVRDYNEAIAYYVDVLGFELRSDSTLSIDKRWVVVAPPGGGAGGIVLAQAVGERQQDAIGNQSGGRVFLFLETDDFERDYSLFRDRGVSFIEAPRQEDYGIVAVFEDLYGNRWDLIEHRAGTRSPPD